MKLTIRKAVSGDLFAMVEFLAIQENGRYRALAEQYAISAFSQDFSRPLFILAFNSDRIIGTAALTEELFTVKVWGISWVNVDEAHRRQGIGEKLIQAALEEIALKADGEVTVILNTFPGKTGLYDRLGFQKAGNDHEGGYFMVKYLQKGS